MQFTLLASALAAFAASAVSASPVSNAARMILDVWAPTIISPNASTVWTEGQQYNVTWDTSNAPVNISNGASVRLGEDGQLTETTLASGFDLRQGWVTITCPSDVIPGNNYSIILFGDSGDQSEQFSIISPMQSILGL
ncbi:hypothetical protein EV361DRAFT_116499 [Lentinula raphanica]|uniref:Yeast cell wall synthesis Kre9/Knh1-like N-terminal domain-containing protein n=1 Tax=Lentinula raphanica TaxID=153919 RepID=A0AA38UGP7_9AGAR|nr:hypothetical protein FB446DRAFT_720132 [Lentinula raphanica]KAJ3825480.1 hypothetical protein F5880DRAFT_1611076 [Lentinula raphanica]KAJ3840525.1 hypothetical protein F5878DRAFT_65813 [Lentinula raphanica]KAJ3972760.1 hypothetical protein EV361DRAFT_116499 [Lentinula raphanica]